MNYHKRNQWLADNGFTSYAAYLESEHWQTIRTAVHLERSCCERCELKNDLQVHHRTYKRIGREMMKDLLLLCGTCHVKEHDLHNERRKERLKKYKKSACCGVRLVLRQTTKTQYRLFCTKCDKRNHRVLHKLKMARKRAEKIKRIEGWGQACVNLNVNNESPVKVSHPFIEDRSDSF